MKLHKLTLESEPDGTTTVSIWADCETPQDVQVLIEWLKLAKSFSTYWAARRKADNVVKVKLHKPQGAA